METFLRFLRWFGVTVWFGIWFLGPAYLLSSNTIHDPRDIFPQFFSSLGCLMLALGWLYITLAYAITDEMPPPFD